MTIQSLFEAIFSQDVARGGTFFNFMEYLTHL